MSEANSMPVKEFARLCEDAQAAVDAGDGAKLGKVNGELRKIGYRVIAKEGKAVIQQLHSPEGIDKPLVP